MMEKWAVFSGEHLRYCTGDACRQDEAASQDYLCELAGGALGAGALMRGADAAGALMWVAAGAPTVRGAPAGGVRLTAEAAFRPAALPDDAEGPTAAALSVFTRWRFGVVVTAPCC